MSFVHLQVHSEFTMGESIARIDDLIAAVKSHGMPAVALTDTHNLFAAVKFYDAAIKAGIKPIFGAEVICAEEKSEFRITLLCQNKEGYRQLTQLLSQAYVDGQIDGQPRVRREWIDQHHAGLLLLLGANSDVGQLLQKNALEEAEQQLQNWRSIFVDACYLSCVPSDLKSADYFSAFTQLANRTETPLLACNDVRFITPDDFPAMEARYCIHKGETLTQENREKRFHPDQYLLSPAVMRQQFAAIPEALTNTIQIAKRCNVQLKLGENVLPDFPIPEGMTINDYIRHQSMLGLEKRLIQLFGDDRDKHVEEYQQRLDIELTVINSMGYPGYFLIVADFIQWAKNNGVPVGPGRGSGAGSLVAYALGITDLDPLKYALLFERFLNPERVSMPDFDIDFCMEGRDRVIEYVAHKYGRESVSQIITFGTMAAKAVVRDVGRVLGHPYGFVDKIAKLIPFEIGITLDKALEQEEELAKRYKDEEDVHLLIDLAKRLEGITRNAGKHAGGVVIAPGKLTEFTPLYCEEGGHNLVTQFDKDDVEAVGLVKFDFLGLRTLTIIDWALKIINKKRHEQQLEPIQIESIPLDDKPTYQLLQRCETTAVFQLESRGMKDLIKRSQPDCFEDIISLVALFRPGPLQSGMVDDFINRKQGLASMEYLHPELEPILQTTYGVILYQEQVMQIAQSLAGYTLGGADLLRRAMGKKKPEEMAKQRAIFTDGATGRNIDKQIATTIFDLMEKFAGYGFNKSHSAAYALVAYQTAWLKAHYPAAFMAAVLSSDMDNTDKVVNFIEDCCALGLKIESPSINHSEYYFTVTEDDTIVFGLGALKGVGAAAIDLIIAARKNGEFTDLYSFCQRVDTRKVNRRVLEALIYSGAMDAIAPNRAVLLAAVEEAIRGSEQHRSNEDRGQYDLFADEQLSLDVKATYPDVPPLAHRVCLAGEKETLGFYLSGHPIQCVQSELSQFTFGNLGRLQEAIGRTVSVAGFVTNVRKLFTKRGKRMAIVSLDDNSAKIDIAVFAEIFDEVSHLLEKETLLVVSGAVAVDDFNGGVRMTAERISRLADLRAANGKSLLITLDNKTATPRILDQLSDCFSLHNHGNLPVVIDYLTDSEIGHYRSDQWRIDPTDACLESLERLVGVGRVTVLYTAREFPILG